jgi:hypothetical protein
MKCRIEPVDPMTREKHLIRNITMNAHTQTVKVRRNLHVLALHRNKAAKSKAAKKKVVQGRMVGVGPLEYCGNGIQVKNTSSKTTR